MTRSSGLEVGERNQRLARGRAQEPDAARQQVVVDVRVVDHLGQEVDPSGGGLVRVLVEGAVGDLDGVLDAEAEAEVPGQLDADRPEVEDARAEVALARVGGRPGGLDAADDRAPVEVGDVELAGHGEGGGGEIYRANAPSRSPLLRFGRLL